MQKTLKNSHLSFRNDLLYMCFRVIYAIDDCDGASEKMSETMQDSLSTETITVDDESRTVNALTDNNYIRH